MNLVSAILTAFLHTERLKTPTTNAQTDSLSKPVVKLLLFCIAVFSERVIYDKCSVRQLYMYLTLQHQMYLNTALQLWNNGFFYSHTEYDIHVHFHLSWWKQIAHAIQTERERFKKLNISLQSVEEYTMTI